ncbi:hypothetical protein Tsubulata_018825 [Turnera subulata]|uniref:DUF632 domain-containing protein n=2 Tax=Turnera subulata TaxID=218843 RepID=A0A9Q0J8W2_9ROSI|nr:hypothetical protein Tsubulata_018825 [Turnera subulata]
MGCGGSKVDDLPLVTLCRERKHNLRAAADYRYALAASHVAYFHSLRHVGDAIRNFVDQGLVVASPSHPSSSSSPPHSSAASPGSPVLTLPREGKNPKHKPTHSSSSSSSPSIPHKGIQHDDDHDSHIHLSSGSDSDPDSDETPEAEVQDRGQGGEDAPSTPYNLNGYPPQPNWGYNPNAYPYPFPYPDPYPYPDQYPTSYPDQYPTSSSQNAYYMKRTATPATTVVYEDQSANASYSGYYGGYFGYPPMTASSPEKPPPQPPSPPRVSTWDYLNVFETYDSGGGYPGYLSGGARYGYGSTTSSPDSKEVREREGIPDLEDETEYGVAKEPKDGKLNGNEEKHNSYSNYYNYGEGEEGTSKSVPAGRRKRSSSADSSVADAVNKGKGIQSSSISPEHDDNSSISSSIVSKSPPEEKKKGVTFEVEPARSSNPTEMDVDTSSSKPSSIATVSAGHGTRDLKEAVKEIRDEFETATDYGKEVALMLEVANLPYQRRTTLLQVILSRILYLVSSHPPEMQSVRISSRTMKMAKEYSGEPVHDFDGRPKNLSSTLEELYAWEKKLYKEVKDEERLRVMYEKQCKRLKYLDEHGAESSKIDATQASIKKLLTKINVSIRAVDAISSKIHRLRDEELQPQITELVHGLIRMWKSMLRCHQKQFQAIMESKVRSLKANTGFGLKATLELEMELMNWCTRFNDWVGTQKAYVKSLNEWLVRCLLHEPEETADGIAPFSPSRIGAPPIFVICNDWYQAMVQISEERVGSAILNFASNLHLLWERQDEEQRQRIKAEYITKDFEKHLRTLHMERERIERAHDALSDKTVSKAPSESGISPLDDLKVDLDSMRKKLEEERARHKEAAKLVHDVASGSLQGGLVPIFEALGSFTSEVLKAHEEVRLQQTGES